MARCSRAAAFIVLQQLTEDQIVLLLRRALADSERGLGQLQLQASDDVLRKIASYSSGDARSAYNALDVAARLPGGCTRRRLPRRRCFVPMKQGTQRLARSRRNRS